MFDQSLRKAFLEDGFVHVPGALDPETVDMALQCWTWSMGNPGPAAARVLPGSLAFVDDVSAARAVPSAEEGFFYQDLDNPASPKIYEGLLKSPAITSLVEGLFDNNQAWFIGEQVFLKEPNSPDTSWHQDISFVNARGEDIVVLWITFDATDEDTGLGLVRGSHRGPVYDRIYGGGTGKPIPNVEARQSEFEIVSYACEPGDVVAFHMSCLHGRGRTRPGQKRRTLALRFFGERCFFESRADPHDPRNGQPYGRKQYRQILPVP